MHATTVGVDLAKHHFQLIVCDEHYRIVRRERLGRARFAQFFANQPPTRIVMEACGSAQHWARTLQAQGHQVELLPAQYVRAYVRRNKTDAADAAALVEAARCADIHPVAIKSVELQALQQLHRMRQQCQRNRTACINQIRGCLREFGIVLPKGAARAIEGTRGALADAENALPDLLRPFLFELLQEADSLKRRIVHLERTLRELTLEDPIVQQLQQIPGVGLVVASAIRTGVGDIHRFVSGRQLACWLGLTAREHSSGEIRRLGKISKQGDAYLRTVLVHGARSALQAAHRAIQAGRSVDHLRTWALQVEQRRGRNKAIVALANKLARIIWATWKHQRRFDGNWALRAATH